MPRSELGADALLKTTGIAASLGALLESRGRSRDAARIYGAALGDLREDEAALSPTERARSVVLARKLASVSRPDTGAAEDAMEYAAATLIKLGATAEQLARAQERAEQGEDGMSAGDITPPRWLQSDQLDLADTLEQLATIYEARGKHECVRLCRLTLTVSLAIPAYLQTLSILGRDRQPSTAHRCRTANVMAQLSAALSHDTARSQNAISWAKQSIAVADKSVAEAPAIEADDAAQCLHCAGIGHVNLGTLYAVRRPHPSVA